MPRIIRRSASRTLATAVLLLAALSMPMSLTAQGANAHVDSLLHALTLDEKLGFLHGARDPDPAVGLRSAGYMPGVARLGIPPLRLTDGPAGIRTSEPATALPAPVALAASFDTGLARRYGDVMGRDGIARNQDVLLAPMVNIVRVPQAGRNFETLGEDPLLASRLVAAEIGGIQGAGMIATVKHFAANNFENDRQRVDARVDARTLHEIYLPAFHAAVRAGVGAVMCSYNRLNGTYACANKPLLTDILRTQFGFGGWVMTDWFAAHDLSALQAGLEQEMPGLTFPGMRSRGVWFADSLKAAVESGRIPMAAVDEAVRRILTQMDRFGLLAGTARQRPPIDTAADDAVARQVEESGAVLLRDAAGTLPVSREALASAVVIGPSARTAMIGGGGSAHVLPMHRTSALDALEHVAGARIRYFPGIDLDGVAVPSEALSVARDGAHGLSRTEGAERAGGRFGAAQPPVAAQPSGPAQTDAQLDFTGARALPAGSAWTWTGFLTAPTTGEYDLELQAEGGRATLSIDDTIRATAGVFFGGASLVPTADGLTNATTTMRLSAGQPVAIRVTADARSAPGAGAAPATPLQVRLAWSTPQRRQQFITEAARAARGARTVLLFAHDEGTEGADRASLSLPARQDALIDAVTRANPHTAVVLSTGSAVLMPWIAQAGAVLETWYPGQEAGPATAALLLGEANPSGKLPVTFPRRAADAPTSDAARYPGVDGEAQYSEGDLVGYRWYDTKDIAPLFPFGHGLSYTTFAYSDLAVRPAGDGFDVAFKVRNTGRVRGTEVAQLYVAAPSPAPVPMAAKQLAGFARVDLAPGEDRTVTIHVAPRELSYWSTDRNGWTVAAGRRAVLVGSSSRDIRLRGSLTARAMGEMR